MGMANRERVGTIPGEAAAPRRSGLIDALGGAGIRVNPAAPDPWDITVRDVAALDRRVLSPWRNGLTELGDLYVEGAWECADLPGFFDRCFSAGLEKNFVWQLPNLAQFVARRIFNQQTRSRASRDVSSHYNLGPVFEVMLEPAMTYSCGYWRDGVSTLEEAQRAKHDLACRKLHLEPGMEVLDIGCGWGAFLSHAARRYGVAGRGVTLSADQVALASERCRDLPVSIELRDYRDVRGRFARVASFGMFEHVGQKNYRAYFEKAHALLDDGGLFLFHSLGSIFPTPTLRTPEVDWVERHIFPGLANPSFGQIAAASDGLFTILDAQEFGAYYDPTLVAWSANFVAGWPSIRDRYDEAFYRTWRYYLAICAAAFRSGKFRVWQVVLGKNHRGVYEAAR